MNKAELISKVAEKTDSTKKDAEKFVNAVFDSIQEALVAGDKVQLVGFGAFEAKQRAERMGRNPRTNEPMPIKAAKVVKFTTGKALKDAVDS